MIVSEKKNGRCDYSWRRKSETVSLNQQLIGFCNRKLDPIVCGNGAYKTRENLITRRPEDFYS